MNDHIIAYEGINVSLALLQSMYRDTYTPWPNKRTDVSGTLQRPPYYPEHFDEWLAHLSKNKGKHEVFAVLMHDGSSKQYIGHMGVHDITWPCAHAKTGSILGADGARGRGYGAEAKLLLQYHAFMVLGLRKLSSEVKAFNIGSLGHLLKCGYQIIGRRKRQEFHEGSYVDSIMLECFREDWEPIWEKYKIERAVPKLTKKQRVLVTKETQKT